MGMMSGWRKTPCAASWAPPRDPIIRHARARRGEVLRMISPLMRGEGWVGSVCHADVLADVAELVVLGAEVPRLLALNDAIEGRARPRQAEGVAAKDQLVMPAEDHHGAAHLLVLQGRAVVEEEVL